MPVIVYLPQATVNAVTVVLFSRRVATTLSPRNSNCCRAEEVEPPARFQYEATEDMLILAALRWQQGRPSEGRPRSNVEISLLKYGVSFASAVLQ